MAEKSLLALMRQVCSTGPAENDPFQEQLHKLYTSEPMVFLREMLKAERDARLVQMEKVVDRAKREQDEAVKNMAKVQAAMEIVKQNLEQALDKLEGKVEQRPVYVFQGDRMDPP